MDDDANEKYVVAQLNQAARHNTTGQLLRLLFWSDGSLSWDVQPHPYDYRY